MGVIAQFGLVRTARWGGVGWSAEIAQAGGCRDHWCSSGVDGVDDFGVVDPLEVDRGDPEVGMAELTLDDDQWHTFACHLNRVGVTELMGGEASPDTGSSSGAGELSAG
jgi:hypothetical protein